MCSHDWLYHPPTSPSLSAGRVHTVTGTPVITGRVSPLSDGVWSVRSVCPPSHGTYRDDRPFTLLQSRVSWLAECTAQPGGVASSHGLVPSGWSVPSWPTPGRHLAEFGTFPRAPRNWPLATALTGEQDLWLISLLLAILLLFTVSPLGSHLSPALPLTV